MSDSRESIEEAEDADADDDQIQQQQQQPNNSNNKKKKEEKKNMYEFRRRLKGAKNLILSPLRKLEEVYERKKMRPPAPPFPYSVDLGGKGRSLCFTQPRVLDSPPRQNSDVKISSYHGFLRSLLERNDFYAPECNVHREI